MICTSQTAESTTLSRPSLPSSAHLAGAPLVRRSGLPLNPQSAIRNPQSNRVSIFVCGILTFPGASDNWTGRAVTWTHLNTGQRAEKVEYFVGPISRVFGDNLRARKLGKTLDYYGSHGWDINLVGHSNGCDVILDALRAGQWRKVRSLHLLSAACSADCEKNGLNELIATGRVGACTVYIAGRDTALRLAGLRTAKLLGYGTLGRGPVNATQIEVVHDRTFGHSDWFDAEHFDHTMKSITA